MDQDVVARRVAAMEATMMAGFKNEARRHDDFRAEMSGRHRENSERLERIEEKQDMTNGNVARHDVEIKNLAGLWRIVLVVIVTTASITAGAVIWLMQLASR